MNSSILSTWFCTVWIFCTVGKVSTLCSHHIGAIVRERFSCLELAISFNRLFWSSGHQQVYLCSTFKHKGISKKSLKTTKTIKISRKRDLKSWLCSPLKLPTKSQYTSLYVTSLSKKCSFTYQWPWSLNLIAQEVGIICSQCYRLPNYTSWTFLYPFCLESWPETHVLAL